jgi:hypothetical protein
VGGREDAEECSVLCGVGLGNELNDQRSMNN